MKAIIFGANGQDGYYLDRLLREQGVEVIGISRNGNFLKTDITKFFETANLIKSVKPDYIFHLAARSTTSHDALFENHDTIVTAGLNLLEASRLYSPGTKIFFSGSGLQFVNHGKPISETDPFDPSSAYCVSRIQSVYAARYYRSLGLKTYVGYFFNHDSPLRSVKHISQKIATAVKRISTGHEEKLVIGNYDVRKEWGYAGDIVEAIWTLVRQDIVPEAIIGTGEAYSIRDWLQLCFQIAGKHWEEYVIQEPGFIPEYDILVSNPKLINSLGWKPDHNFQDLAQMMMK